VERTLCIRAQALRKLADALDRLDLVHRSMHGPERDRPCLRRIEVTSEGLIAHISTGPPVGGAWERLVYLGGDWRFARG